MVAKLSEEWEQLTLFPDDPEPQAATGAELRQVLLGQAADDEIDLDKLAERVAENFRLLTKWVESVAAEVPVADER